MRKALARGPTSAPCAPTRQAGGYQRTRCPSSGRHSQAYTHDCTVLADSSHGDSHVGSVSPAATRTRTLALTLTLTRTRTLTLALTRTEDYRADDFGTLFVDKARFSLIT